MPQVAIIALGAALFVAVLVGLITYRGRKLPELCDDVLARGCPACGGREGRHILDEDGAPCPADPEGSTDWDRHSRQAVALGNSGRIPHIPRHADDFRRWETELLTPTDDRTTP